MKAPSQKMLKMNELAQVRERHPGKKIVHCHGVFDLLHSGHLLYFQSAKKFGDCLVVTVTADEFVTKGPGRPYFTGSLRAGMLAALEVVDFVAISEHSTAVPVIEALRPHIYAKGPDYRDLGSDYSRGIFAEKKAVEKNGGQLVVTTDDTHSSSRLINQFFAPWNERQLQAIEMTIGNGGLDAIKDVFSRMEKERVCIFGEPIIDTYVFCQPEAISSKSPSISARFIREENYAGGSLAIANFLSDFVEEVQLVITYGGEPYVEEVLREKLDPRVKLVAEKVEGVPTPRKVRYIEVARGQRMFELTHIESDQWFRQSPKGFCQTLKKAHEEASTTILADFGHGMFEADVMQTIRSLEGFLALNVQTNSSNLGFNPFTKHKNYSYLSIDTMEVRVAYHDRFTPPVELARQTWKRLGPEGIAFSMTLGVDGSCYFPANEEAEFVSPAFADTVVDATGAGDAFFGLTALMVKVEAPHGLVPFVGNVFAGLKTRIMGHQRSVKKRELLKTLTSILK